MVTCAQYSNEKRTAWDTFVRSCRSKLFIFERDFMEYHSDRFIDHSFMFYECGKLVALLPASQHDDVITSHGGLSYGGLLYSDKVRAKTILDVFSALQKSLYDCDYNKLIYKAIPYIFHKQPSQEDIYALYRNNASLTRRDLSSIIHLDNRTKLSKGRKWLINRAKNAGLLVSASENWEAFYALLKQVLKRHGATPVHSASELEYLASKFPHNILLKTVVHNGELLAGTLLFIFDQVVHTQYIATSTKGKELGALDFLLEQLINESHENGYKYFSFGISTEEDGKYLNDGLISQKESFGARSIVLDHYELHVKA